MTTRHLWEPLKEEGDVNEHLIGGLHEVAVPHMRVNVAHEPTLVVPRLASFVTTRALALKNIAFHKAPLCAFLDDALAKTVNGDGRAENDPPRLLVLHLANLLACCGAASATAWSGLRGEIDRAARLGWDAWKPFRPSDHYTPALAALALRTPNRAAIVAKTPSRAGRGDTCAESLEAFLHAVTTNGDVAACYDTIMMWYVVDLGHDYPEKDDLTRADGGRFFDPNTMLWVARVRHALVGGASVGSVAMRLRRDLRDYVGLKDD